LNIKLKDSAPKKTKQNQTKPNQKRQRNMAAAMNAQEEGFKTEHAD